jgi:DNA (cytosine-5)-methyltransferase 1
VSAYYNDNDPHNAAWLRELIRMGVIAPGDVDDRSITDVRPEDLAGYAQCHFFAGIGAWSYALRLAGWPDDRPVWTGSCPCQPLSSAGQRLGHADDRHLWPALYALITARRPPAFFGEQVASADGREWLAAVRADLGHLGYAVGAADLPAAGVGAPHIRQRLWFVAHAAGGGGGRIRQSATRDGPPEHAPGGHGGPGRALADADGQRRDGGTRCGEDRGAADGGAEARQRGPTRVRFAQGRGAAIGMADARGAERQGSERDGGADAGAGRGGPPDDRVPRPARAAHCREYSVCYDPNVCDADRCWLAAQGLDHPRPVADAAEQGRGERQVGPAREDGRPAAEPRRLRDLCGVADADGGQPGQAGAGRLQRGGQHGQQQADGGTGFWTACDWIVCRDGKSRPVEPGSFPLVDGAAFRVGSGGPYEGKSRAAMLRAYGNAIVPEVAAAFVGAAMDCIP